MRSRLHPDPSRRRFVRIPGLVAAVGFVVAPAAIASDWYVDATAVNCASATGGANDPFCTIAAALAVAFDGDTIHVAPGTYVENLGVAADVTLLGTNGAAATIVDGGRNGSVVDVAPGATVAIAGLTLRNGLAAAGGGVRIGAGAALSLSQAVVEDNVVDATTQWPDQGGGIAVDHATLLVDDCRISANEAAHEGGGLFNDGGTVVITNSTISSNRTGLQDDANDYGYGGGVSNHGGAVTLVNSTLDANEAGTAGFYGAWGFGGAIYTEDGSVTLDRSVVRDGFASVYGGALAAVDSTLALTSCEVRDNKGERGGALDVDGGTATLERSSIHHNEASEQSYFAPVRGGGIHAGAGTLVLTECRIADNSAYVGAGLYALGDATLVRCSVLRNVAMDDPPIGAHSGGIYSSGDLVLDGCEVLANVVIGSSWAQGGGVVIVGDATITNSTIAGNRCDDGSGAAIGDGGGIWNGFGVCAVGHSVVAGNSALTNDLEGTIDSLGYNCIGDTFGGTITGDPTGNQLDVDPQFADAANGDYSLASTSPCLDAGDPALAPGGMDLAGNPRLLDGDLDRHLIVDLGAREFDHVRLAVTGSATPGGTLTFDTTGTSGLSLFLFAGAARSELHFQRYGALFVDLGSPWILLPWGTIPDTTNVVVDPSLPVPLTVELQQLALDPAQHAGNFGNLVTLAIE